MAAETDTVDAPDGVGEPVAPVAPPPPVELDMEAASTAKSIKATRTRKRVFFIILCVGKGNREFLEEKKRG